MDDADHLAALDHEQGLEILWLFRASSASATRASGGMTRGRRVITCSTGVSS